MRDQRVEAAIVARPDHLAHTDTAATDDQRIAVGPVITAQCRIEFGRPAELAHGERNRRVQ